MKLSKPTYEKKVRNGIINVMRRGCRGRETLINYMSLPSEMKDAYCTKSQIVLFSGIQCVLQVIRFAVYISSI